jgi:hypothetical protein
MLGLANADERFLFPAGIVYGLTAAFQVSAPEGWVVDNKSGMVNNQPCVMYPAGSSWSASPVVMYARIASLDYTENEKFSNYAVDFFKKDDPNFKYKKVASGKTPEGFKYFINEYERPSYPLFEQVAYIQLPKAVAYVVYSAQTKDIFEKNYDKLDKVLSSFRYREDYIGYNPK